MKLKQFKAEGPAVDKFGENELRVMAPSEKEAQRVFGRALDQPEEHFDVIKLGTPEEDLNPLNVTVTSGDDPSFLDSEDVIKELNPETVGWGLFEEQPLMEAEKMNALDVILHIPREPLIGDWAFLQDICEMEVEGKNGEGIEQGYLEALEHHLRERLNEVEDEEVIEIAKKVNEHSGWEQDGEAIEVENVLPDTLRDHLSDYEVIKNKTYESKL